MKNKFIGELILSIALIALLLLFLTPLTLMMPTSMHPLMIPLLVILFVIFTAMIWKEQPGDERDQLHKFIASRFAYFAAVTTMTIGIIVQHNSGPIDPWLIIALCITLLAKLLGIFYSYLKH